MRKLNKFVLLTLLLPVSGFCGVIQKVIDPSVAVHIKLLEDDGKYHKAGCSGTYVSKYTILTAAHCVDSTHFFIWAQDDKGRTFECKLVKINTVHDLALLGIVSKNYKGHKYSKLGNRPLLGNPITVVGSPFFLNFMISQGIVSKLHVFIPPFTGRYTLHTAMINAGSSGGGLFNSKGRLIGVNTLSLGGVFGWAGISGAVDLETIKEFLR